jgi:hypothetical protein
MMTTMHWNRSRQPHETPLDQNKRLSPLCSDQCPPTREKRSNPNQSRWANDCRNNKNMGAVNKKRLGLILIQFLCVMWWRSSNNTTINKKSTKDQDIAAKSTGKGGLENTLV